MIRVFERARKAIGYSMEGAFVWKKYADLELTENHLRSVNMIYYAALHVPSNELDDIREKYIEYVQLFYSIFAGEREEEQLAGYETEQFRIEVARAIAKAGSNSSVYIDEIDEVYKSTLEESKRR